MPTFNEIETYLARVRKLFLYAVGPSLFLPVIGYMTNIIPPWPQFAAILSSIFVLLVTVVVFSLLYGHSLRRRSRPMLVFFVIFAVTALLYTYLYSNFIYEPPNSGRQIVVGCGFQEQILLVAGDYGASAGAQCPGNFSRLMEAFNYNEFDIWTRASINNVRLLVFAAWLAMISSATLVLSALVVKLRPDG